MSLRVSLLFFGRASATRSATANDSCATSSRPPWGLLGGGVAQHFWSKEAGKVALPWGRGAYVGVDLCGRLQPLSQKVECYSKRNRPHPVPPQDAVDYSLNDLFERLEFDLRENIVFLFVDDCTNSPASEVPNGVSTTLPSAAECFSLMRQYLGNDRFRKNRCLVQQEQLGWVTKDFWHPMEPFVLGCEGAGHHTMMVRDLTDETAAGGHMRTNPVVTGRRVAAHLVVFADSGFCDSCRAPPPPPPRSCTHTHTQTHTRCQALLADSVNGTVTSSFPTIDKKSPKRVQQCSGGVAVRVRGEQKGCAPAPARESSKRRASRGAAAVPAVGAAFLNLPLRE